MVGTGRYRQEQIHFIVQSKRQGMSNADIVVQFKLRWVFHDFTIGSVKYVVNKYRNDPTYDAPLVMPPVLQQNQAYHNNLAMTAAIAAAQEFTRAGGVLPAGFPGFSSGSAQQSSSMTTTTTTNPQSQSGTSIQQPINLDDYQYNAYQPLAPNSESQPMAPTPSRNPRHRRTQGRGRQLVGTYHPAPAQWMRAQQQQQEEMQDAQEEMQMQAHIMDALNAATQFLDPNLDPNLFADGSQSMMAPPPPPQSPSNGAAGAATQQFMNPRTSPQSSQQMPSYGSPGATQQFMNPRTPPQSMNPPPSPQFSHGAAGSIQQSFDNNMYGAGSQSMAPRASPQSSSRPMTPRQYGGAASRTSPQSMSMNPPTTPRSSPQSRSAYGLSGSTQQPMTPRQYGDASRTSPHSSYGSPGFSTQQPMTPQHYGAGSVYLAPRTSPESIREMTRRVSTPSMSSRYDLPRSTQQSMNPPQSMAAYGSTRQSKITQYYGVSGPQMTPRASPRSSQSMNYNQYGAGGQNMAASRASLQSSQEMNRNQYGASSQPMTAPRASPQSSQSMARASSQSSQQMSHNQYGAGSQHMIVPRSSPQSSQSMNPNQYGAGSQHMAAPHSSPQSSQSMASYQPSHSPTQTARQRPAASQAHPNQYKFGNPAMNPYQNQGGTQQMTPRQHQAGQPMAPRRYSGQPMDPRQLQPGRQRMGPYDPQNVQRQTNIPPRDILTSGTSQSQPGTSYPGACDQPVARSRPYTGSPAKAASGYQASLLAKGVPPSAGSGPTTTPLKLTGISQTRPPPTSEEELRARKLLFAQAFSHVVSNPGMFPPYEPSAEPVAPVSPVVGKKRKADSPIYEESASKRRNVAGSAAEQPILLDDDVATAPSTPPQLTSCPPATAPLAPVAQADKKRKANSPDFEERASLEEPASKRHDVVGLGPADPVDSSPSEEAFEPLPAPEGYDPAVLRRIFEGFFPCNAPSTNPVPPAPGGQDQDQVSGTYFQDLVECGETPVESPAPGGQAFADEYPNYEGYEVVEEEEQPASRDQDSDSVASIDEESEEPASPAGEDFSETDSLFGDDGEDLPASQADEDFSESDSLFGEGSLFGDDEEAQAPLPVTEESSDKPQDVPSPGPVMPQTVKGKPQELFPIPEPVVHEEAVMGRQTWAENLDAFLKFDFLTEEGYEEREQAFLANAPLDFPRGEYAYNR